MAGDIEKAAVEMGLPAERLADHLLRQQSNDRAMSEPLPGAVRDAFSPVQDIKVGPYSVRPCYDGDIEYLSLLKHPLHEMRMRARASKSGQVENLYEPQGPKAWELCFLFTHSLDEIDEIVAKGGLSALQTSAKKEFSRKQLLALVEISNAAVQQYVLYWQPVLGYGVAAPEGEDSETEKKTSSVPATGSMTASGS